MTASALISKLCDGNRNDPAREFWALGMLENLYKAVFVPKRHAYHAKLGPVVYSVERRFFQVL